jgi:hypothetical protein
MTHTKTQTTLVLGGTGKASRRVAQRLTALGRPARVGSRSGRPRFDWQDQATWGPALDDVAAVYVSYYPDLATPGAVELLTYLFGKVLDGRNARVADGVRRALGRESRDFARYARDAAASGVWDNPAASGADR